MDLWTVFTEIFSKVTDFVAHQGVITLLTFHLSKRKCLDLCIIIPYVMYKKVLSEGR